MMVTVLMAVLLWNAIGNTCLRQELTRPGSMLAELPARDKLNYLSLALILGPFLIRYLRRNLRP